MDYSIEKCDSASFEVIRGGKLFWSVTFTHPLTQEYGFRASDGVSQYRLVKSGFFFWKTLILFKDGRVVGRFKRNKCLDPNPHVWLDSRKFVYEGTSYVCSLDSGRSGYLLSWALERKELEILVVVLALICLQGRVRIWTSSIP